MVLTVTMEEMFAEQTAGGVLVHWTTATEIDTVGFRVLRETTDRSKTLETLAPLIPAMGNDFTGASYEFLDNTRSAARAVRYFIEDVDVFGKVTRHGPIVVERARPGRVKPDQRVMDPGGSRTTLAGRRLTNRFDNGAPLADDYRPFRTSSTSDGSARFL